MQHPQLSPQAAKYLQDIQSSWKLWLYFFKNLPSALWWGFKVKSASTERTEVTIPYNWRTQNPFKSIYFAALAGAGELSTGVMATLARMSGGDVSMLVLEQRAEFVKKANTLTTFTCEDGQAVFETVKKAVSTRQPQTITMLGTGRNTDGEVVARIYITWTFKLRGF
ncbi:MAG: DUF4442 domain-containing protein [Saprospiraceae bacterium]|nr:DUF4442 domain-containing protein [Saprospiraceae bacterium]MCF8249917.1 DUF4442 domain-containing protein [Saprospiraceae bacterium]MCF8279330.1 DUF4442 domain-containing protein [Bacteroidales bacterium]MCF8310021.1 DUF4442 domain-containing protein [Saprospiraceae bacterium]MCF8438921.1 DUF4442 domain-containing protein [Saprospiraceae bacterium]